jgi:hypothetical protein
MRFQDIDLNTAFSPGAGTPVAALPDRPGIYAQVHWPQRGLRIGETGRSIRAKIRHDIRWFEAMFRGTAPPAQLRRTLPIAQAAKAGGASGFEFFVVSTDPRLQDKELRQAAERALFAWAAASPDFVDWNRQRSWR